MNPDSNVPATTSIPNVSTSASIQPSVYDINRKWSWGAAMLNFIYLIAIKKYKYLLLFLLMLIPFVNMLAWIGLPLYFGFFGGKLAYQSSMFANKTEADAFMRAINHAGKVCFFLYVIFVIISVVLIFLSGFILPHSIQSPAYSEFPIMPR